MVQTLLDLSRAAEEQQAADEAAKARGAAANGVNGGGVAMGAAAAGGGGGVGGGYVQGVEMSGMGGKGVFAGSGGKVHLNGGVHQPLAATTALTDQTVQGKPPSYCAWGGIRGLG